MHTWNAIWVYLFTFGNNQHLPFSSCQKPVFLMSWLIIICLPLCSCCTSPHLISLQEIMTGFPAPQHPKKTHAHLWTECIFLSFIPLSFFCIYIRQNFNVMIWYEAERSVDKWELWVVSFRIWPQGCIYFFSLLKELVISRIWRILFPNLPLSELQILLYQSSYQF